MSDKTDLTHAQTITVGADLPTTFGAAVSGLIRAAGTDTIVALSLYEDDWTSTTELQNFSVGKVLASKHVRDLTGADDQAFPSEYYLVAYPYTNTDDVRGREPGAEPRLIPTDRIARIHVY